MRIGITGATGFVGSHAAEALRSAGHELRLLVRSPEKLARVFAERGLPVPEHVVGDIGDEAPVKDFLQGCDVVVHTAAVVAMKATRAREIEETNARGVENVIGGAARAGVSRIVYVSSIGALFVPEGPVVTPDSPVVPGDSPYARSKSDAELRVRELAAAGAPVRTVYPCGVLGPHDPGLSEANHALRTFARDVVLHTSGGFQMVDVRDLAAIVAALAEGAGAADRYVAAGPFLRWPEIGDVIDELTGVRVRRLAVPGALLRAGGVVGDLVKRFWDFDFPMTREGMCFATQWGGADGSAVARDLGLGYRTAAETMGDGLRWMHAAGHIEAKHVGRLADAQ